MVGCLALVLIVISLFIWIVGGVQSLFVFLIIFTLICGFISHIEGKKGSERLRIEAARLKALEISDVDNMDGFLFEHYVAKLLWSEGYTQVEVTKSSGDLGIDIFATKGTCRFAIQVKRYAKTVPRSAISDAVAGKSHFARDRAMVITNSFMSRKSYGFALSVGCEIVDRNTLCEWIMRYQGRQKGEPPVENSARVITVPAPKPALTTEIMTQTPSQPKQYLLESLNRATITTNPLTDEPVIENIASSVDDVIEAIKKRAATECPGDYSLQAHIVEKDIKAYYDLHNIDSMDMPTELLARILTNARKDWNDNYSMQIYVVDKNVKAYSELKNLYPTDVSLEILSAIKKDAVRDCPYDLVMQVYIVKRQLESVRKLNRLTMRIS